MHTLSTRTLVALAYERGEEFDPALATTPALVEELSLSAAAARPIEAPSPYERRRTRQRARRAELGRMPEWFSPCDLVGSTLAGASGAVVHGEPV